MLKLCLRANFIHLKYLKNINTALVRRYFSVESISPVKLAFATYGKNSSEPPFVIIHGLFGSKQNWASLCKSYSQKLKPERKVIALDLRNHGDSEHADEHSYNHLAEDVRHFLTENSLKKICLMGHSMGGRCAMLFALRYPELLEKLIVVDISPFEMSPNISHMPKIIEIMQRVQMPQNVPMSQARIIVGNQLAETIISQDLRAFILTNLVPTENQSYRWRVNTVTLMKKFHEISRFPEVSNVQFKEDTLFLGGAESDYLPFIKNVRFNTDLAQIQNYRNPIDLSYASYQSTDVVMGRVKPEDIPTPIVIMHGFLSSKSCFHTICKRYHDGSNPKRSVYAVDLRNHGDSPHSKENGYDDLIQDVIKFLRTMNLSKVFVIGHDIGGRVGMLMSLKYPEVVKKLIVSDTSPITTSHNYKVFPEILKILNNIDFPRNVPLQNAKIYVVGCLARVVKHKEFMTLVLMNLVQKSDGSYTWRFNNKVLLEHYEELSSFPDVHNINFDGPVLFLGGSKSDYLPKSDFPKILKLFPKAELKYIEGAGHWVHAEKPNEFLKITSEFLDKKDS